MEKKLLVITFIVAWVIAGALWLVLPNQEPERSQAQEPTNTAELTGFPTEETTPTPAPESFPAQVTLTKGPDQTIDVSITVDKPQQLVGAEINFELSVPVQLVTGACGADWSCPKIAAQGQMVTISALRPLAKIATPLRGTILVARLHVVAVEPAEWVFNTGKLAASSVLAKDNPDSLLTPYLTTLTITP